LAVLTDVTLASSNSALPKDGDYTETCWVCFNVNFNNPFKKICASVGVKSLIIAAVSVFINKLEVLNEKKWHLYNCLKDPENLGHPRQNPTVV